MTTTVNTTDWALDDLLAREWISVNGMGGFASSTVPGFNTRKYHGLLVAAMSPPVRRMVLLSRVEETVTQAGQSYPLACGEYPGAIHPRGDAQLRAFSADPFPRWAFQASGWTLEKELRLLRGSNTVVLTYALLAGAEPAALEIRPLLAMRGIHELMYQWNGRLDAETRGTDDKPFHRIPPTGRTPEVFFAHDGEFDGKSCWYLNTIYRRECQRGYAGLEDLWMPGAIRFTLRPGQPVHFVCSTEPIDLAQAIADSERQTVSSIASVVANVAVDSSLEALKRAADQFIVHSAANANSTLTENAASVITAYPWSPPSVRDALIGFGGLFLSTRRFDEARSFLVGLAGKISEGLIPTLIPEDGSDPTYEGADTSLWFINAVHDYVRDSGDAKTLQTLLFDACARIIEHYRAGTSLGIKLDADGLIGSRMPGLGTSWMDAKVGDWVITPRQGRCVELNALWYNALRIVAPWCEQFDQPRRCGELTALANDAKVAFNRAFWHEQANCCYDVVMDQGADASIRPNQLLAISLPYAVLNEDRWPRVIETIQKRLLTPMGLRTLSPEDPAYQGQYSGDVVSRDRAYHQGSVHPWLLGPYITALTRTRGRTPLVRAEALEILRGCLDHIDGHGLGQIGELFDGDPPHRGGGAIACARSVGQLLRCYQEEVLGRENRGEGQEECRSQNAECRMKIPQ